MSSPGAEPAVGGIRPGRLVVVSGPGGVGKGTAVAGLARRRPEVELSVSATTRRPRSGEVDGVHYRFLDDADFRARAAAGEFLEWAEFNGRCYGTLRDPVEAARATGRTVLLEIEVQGARQVREREPDAVLVFVAPPSRDELLARLRERGDDPDAVARRLAIAEWELAQQSEFDHVIVNDDLEKCVDEMERILDTVVTAD
jgi:guanylate kinase